MRRGEDEKKEEDPDCFMLIKHRYRVMSCHSLLVPGLE
jgi:hypothetical protein